VTDKDFLVIVLVGLVVLAVIIDCIPVVEDREP
jgi:hypothetical protein